VTRGRSGEAWLGEAFAEVQYLGKLLWSGHLVGCSRAKIVTNG
jgi:hypothetical protein